MAARHPASPAMQLHHGPSGPPPPGIAPPQQWSAAQQLVAMNEAVWLQIGSFAELLGDPDEASTAYMHALRANPRSIPAMLGVSSILKAANQWSKASEYLQNILKLDASNGEVWGNLGHSYLMLDELQQAYSAYQQALYHMPDPKEPKLWYGIGILYDRYGSLEHAEEAFSQVMRMAPEFEKANEIYFRLGIIYKQQKKYQQSLDCFRYICSSPPHPLTEDDIWFQIGHVYEQNADYENAKLAYRRVLERDPNHAKVLQQLGWLYHQDNTRDGQETAIEYLEKSVNQDQNDAQSWYLLGRCYMQQQKYPKAYEAYQQAVYRDGRNPTFWCSIGVLYYQINQYRDALDAYSRAIRLNPYISEVWYDLGTLYESCNNQVNDALDAYQRSAELDPTNNHIKSRLQLLRSGQTGGAPGQASAPLPQDVHPQAYQASGAVGPPGPQWGNPAPPAPPAPPGGPAVNNGWGSRLADIGPQASPYERDPRVDQHGRLYPPGGPAADRLPPPPPPPASRRSPPREHHVQMGPYPGPGLPQPPPPLSQAPPPPPPPPQARAPNNYSAPGPSTVLPLGPSALNGSGPSIALPPFGRVGSPRPEVRPIMENRAPSPKPSYPRMPYQHHPDASNLGGIEVGAPPPPSALAAETAATERNGERPGSAGPKRLREWEEDTSMKKPASEEARAQLDNRHHRRPSSPLVDPTRGSSSEIRRAEEQRHIEEQRRMEDQRRANENYHPSEAAHHPPTHGAPTHLPPMQSGPALANSPAHEHPPAPPPPPPPAPKEYPAEERERERERLDRPPPPPPPPVGEPERAARKMEVDEDYDDEGDEEKKASTSGSGPGSASGEGKTGSPVGVNGRVANGVGMSNGQTKVEQPA